MTAPRSVAFVVPTDEEFAPYRALLPTLRPADAASPWEIYEAEHGGRRLALVISGAGPVNAAAATERLIARYAPVALLHGGSAGAHNPELLPGDVVLGARYVIIAAPGVREGRVARGLHPSLIRFRRDGKSVHLDEITPDPTLLDRAQRIGVAEAAQAGEWTAPGWPVETPRRSGRVIAGLIGTADAWTVQAEEVLGLREGAGAECEDMESAYVAQVCATHALPFIAVRVISNNEAARQLFPTEVRPAIAAAGERAARILVALAATA
jgi:adenosylhomocysteine nucleosidase